MEHTTTILLSVQLALSQTNLSHSTRQATVCNSHLNLMKLLHESMTMPCFAFGNMSIQLTLNWPLNQDITTRQVSLITLTIALEKISQTSTWRSTWITNSTIKDAMAATKPCLILTWELTGKMCTLQIKNLLTVLKFKMILASWLIISSKDLCTCGSRRMVQIPYACLALIMSKVPFLCLTSMTS